MDGYRLRRGTLDDVPAIAEVVRANQLAWTGRTWVTEGNLRVWWGAADLDRDAWVVEGGDGLVATALVRAWAPDRPEVFVNVHPEHLGRGIGSELLPLVEERAREIGAAAAPDAPVLLYQHALEQDEPRRRLLEASGYRAVRRFWTMEASLAEEPAEPAWADGITLEHHSTDTEYAVYDAIEEAFEDHWNNVRMPYDEWRAWALHEDTFDPGLWFVAREGDEIAGVSLCALRRDGRGWVYVLGVRRPWRRRGVGLALLLASMREFRRRGVAVAGLDVDSDNLTGATRLYERAGMQVTLSGDAFEKVLRDGAPAA